MKTLNLQDLQQRYRDLTQSAVAHCTLRTELVGGMSADRAGVEAFVAHHLHLAGEEAGKAVERILKEEIGERDVTPAGGELQEKLTYGICIIRRDEYGPWLGDWMVKACLKAAASRLGLFVSKRGVKGDMAEMGKAQAVGESLRNAEHPERIYLLGPEGKWGGKITPAVTCFQPFKGRVQTPQGSMSIVSDRECAPPGTRFAFEFRWAKGKLTEDDMANIFASAMNLGLGSAKAFERGKFNIESLEISEKG